MARTLRRTTTAFLLATVIGGPLSGTVFAAGNDDVAPVSDAGLSRLTLNGDDLASSSLRFASTDATAFAGQIYQGPPVPMRRRHDAAIAAIMVGALASITGAAVLVYANRPECSTNQLAGGCGYGTKVVGGAVLSGGLVGMFVGALTWR